MGNERIAEVLAEEESSREGWWWLSFVGDDGFRGACIVKARGFIGALIEARRLSCNPGGQVKGIGPMSLDAPIHAGWKERLLTREEAERLQSEQVAAEPPPGWSV